MHSEPVRCVCVPLGLSGAAVRSDPLSWTIYPVCGMCRVRPNVPSCVSSSRSRFWSTERRTFLSCKNAFETHRVIGHCARAAHSHIEVPSYERAGVYVRPSQGAAQPARIKPDGWTPIQIQTCPPACGTSPIARHVSHNRCAHALRYWLSPRWGSLTRPHARDTPWHTLTCQRCHRIDTADEPTLIGKSLWSRESQQLHHRRPSAPTHSAASGVPLTKNASSCR